MSNDNTSSSTSPVEVETMIVDSPEPRRPLWKRVATSPTVRSVVICTAATLTLVRVIDAIMNSSSTRTENDEVDADTDTDSDSTDEN